MLILMSALTLCCSSLFHRIGDIISEMVRPSKYDSGAPPPLGGMCVCFFLGGGYLGSLGGRGSGVREGVHEEGRRLRGSKIFFESRRTCHHDKSSHWAHWDVVIQLSALPSDLSWSRIEMSGALVKAVSLKRPPKEL